MRHKVYKNLLFDMDGTLIDPLEGIKSSVVYALEKMNIDERDLPYIRSFIGPPLYESFTKYFHLNEEDSLQAIKFFREYYNKYGIYQNFLYPGVRELIEQLYEAGYQLYVATSKLQIFAQRIIDHYELNNYFTYVAGSLPSGERSQKEEVVQYIIESYHLKKEDCLMIGDRKHDIIGAKKNGIDSLAITYGYAESDEFEEFIPQYLFHKVEEVLDFFICS